MQSSKQIIAEANELARKFYQSHGYEVRKGYRFDLATHPHETGMWNLAVIAFDALRGIDLDDLDPDEDTPTRPDAEARGG